MKAKELFNLFLITLGGIAIGFYAGLWFSRLVHRLTFESCPHWPSGFDCMGFPWYKPFLPIIGALMGPFASLVLRDIVLKLRTRDDQTR